eukprot:c12035_g1_i1.p1 GENE.c12035_g1_i1~~c12035_g1_i1.p1  ORF type:complete len:878 (+),score=210.42 c12035_g1_i1:341-2974(+)
MDGSTASMFVKRVFHSRNWVVSLGNCVALDEARSDCTDENSCALFRRQFEKFWKNPTNFGGIFLNQNDTESHRHPLEDSNQVFIPDCSGDGWLGRSVQNVPNSGGARILEAVMHTLATEIKSSQIFVLASSRTLDLIGALKFAPLLEQYAPDASRIITGNVGRNAIDWTSPSFRTFSDDSQFRDWQVAPCEGADSPYECVFRPVLALQYAMVRCSVFLSAQIEGEENSGHTQRISIEGRLRELAHLVMSLSHHHTTPIPTQFSLWAPRCFSTGMLEHSGIRFDHIPDQFFAFSLFLGNVLDLASDAPLAEDSCGASRACNGRYPRGFVFIENREDCPMPCKSNEISSLATRPTTQTPKIESNVLQDVKAGEWFAVDLKFSDNILEHDEFYLAGTSSNLQRNFMWRCGPTRLRLIFALNRIRDFNFAIEGPLMKSPRAVSGTVHPGSFSLFSTVNVRQTSPHTCVVWVQARDEFENALTVGGEILFGIVEGASMATLRLRDFNNGSYAAMIPIERSGNYQVQIVRLRMAGENSKFTQENLCVPNALLLTEKVSTTVNIRDVTGKDFKCDDKTRLMHGYWHPSEDGSGIVWRSIRCGGAVTNDDAERCLQNRWIGIVGASGTYAKQIYHTFQTLLMATEVQDNVRFSQMASAVSPFTAFWTMTGDASEESREYSPTQILQQQQPVFVSRGNTKLSLTFSNLVEDISRDFQNGEWPWSNSESESNTPTQMPDILVILLSAKQICEQQVRIPATLQTTLSKSTIIWVLPAQIEPSEGDCVCAHLPDLISRLKRDLTTISQNSFVFDLNQFLQPKMCVDMDDGLCSRILERETRQALLQVMCLQEGDRVGTLINDDWDNFFFKAIVFAALCLAVVVFRKQQS